MPAGNLERPLHKALLETKLTRRYALQLHPYRQGQYHNFPGLITVTLDSPLIKYKPESLGTLPSPIPPASQTLWQILH